MRERREHTRRTNRNVRGGLRTTAKRYPQFALGPLPAAQFAETLRIMKPAHLILPADMATEGRDSRYLAKLRKRGQLVCVRRGVYVNAAEWHSMDSATQYELGTAAFHTRSQQPPVFCYATAALVWGLWLVGHPQKIHIITESRAGGRSHDDICTHVGSLTQGVVQCGGLLFTDKLTTTLQLITALPFERAVAICDSSLHRPWRPKRENVFTAAGVPGGQREPSWRNDLPQGPSLHKSELLASVAQLPSKAARTRATAVIAFASELSGSAGESLSRVRMAQLGFPTPELQQQFVLRDGSSAFVDFWFKAQRRVGEFDGRTKYLRTDWGAGRSLQDRILQEKDREDQIRAQGVGVVRWTWTEMMDLQRFERLLLQAGIPQN